MPNGAAAVGPWLDLAAEILKVLAPKAIDLARRIMAGEQLTDEQLRMELPKQTRMKMRTIAKREARKAAGLPT